MFEKQKTIAKKISIIGFDIDKKNKIVITLTPASINTGFVFKRIDLKDKPSIKVKLSSFFIKKSILEKNGLKIYYIEHIVAAFNGFGIDNIIVELDNVKVPVLDGTAKIFVEAIEKVGVIEQNANKKIFSIQEIFSIKNKKIGGEIVSIPSNDLEIVVIVDFESKYINTQNAIFSNNNIKRFKKISKSKTFCIVNNKNFYKNLDITNSNVLNSNEFAEHSLLDIIGFLSLIEFKLKGKLIIFNPNNVIIIEFLKILMEKIYNNSNNLKKLNFSYKKTIFNIKNILKILPHRYPFLFIDKIIDLSSNYIIGIKNVTINESFFIGHFKNEPVMPGVLQIEAIAQVGGILILSKFKNPRLYSTYLIKIDKVKFKKKVIPGDTIVIKVCLLESMKRGIVHMKGIGIVNEELVVEANIIAKITKITL